MSEIEFKGLPIAARITKAIPSHQTSYPEGEIGLIHSPAIAGHFISSAQDNDGWNTLDAESCGHLGMTVHIDFNHHQLSCPAPRQVFDDRMHHLTGSAGWRVEIGQDRNCGFLEEIISLAGRGFDDPARLGKSGFTMPADDFLSPGGLGIQIGFSAICTANFNFICQD